MNDVEESIKFAVLSDIERDQRLNAFKEAFEKNSKKAEEDLIDLDNKRKQDHLMFNRHIKKAKED